MKTKAQPCLRDYLTVHVPCSVMNGGRGRRRKQTEEENPLMNKKLQTDKKNGVEIIYNSTKSFGKKRKLERIPLLSNLRIGPAQNLKVIKDPRKSEYNLLFEKTKTDIDQRSSNFQESSHRYCTLSQDKIITITTSRSNMRSHNSHRQSASSLLNNPSLFSKMNKALQTADITQKFSQFYESKSPPQFSVSGFKLSLRDSSGFQKQGQIPNLSYQRFSGKRIYISN